MRSCSAMAAGAPSSPSCLSRRPLGLGFLSGSEGGGGGGAGRKEERSGSREGLGLGFCGFGARLPIDVVPSTNGRPR